jgi:hypothetical protein
MRAVQYVLLYEETERWPFPGPAGIAYIQTGPAEGGEAPCGCLRLPQVNSNASQAVVLTYRVVGFYSYMKICLV